MIFIFLFVIVLCFVLLFARSRRSTLPLVVSVYFGAPGSGKTSLAALMASESLKKGIPVYSNVPIRGCYAVSASDLGVYDMSGGHLIVDEAGIEFNNRDFKSFPRAAHEFFKLHRHFRCHVDIFSQSYDDFDKKIRLLAQRYYVVTRTAIPGLVKVQRYVKRVGVNDMTKDFCDLFEPVSIFAGGTSFRWVRPAWSLYDSWDCPPLEKKEFDIYT